MEFFALWISKDEVGRIADLRAPVTVLEGQYGYVAKSMAIGKGATRTNRFRLSPARRKSSPSFARRASTAASKAPRIGPNSTSWLERDVLPKKGRLNEAERARETAPEFMKMKKWRTGIESCINNLERRGLNRVYSYGTEGFERMASFRSSRRPFIASVFWNFAALRKSGVGKKKGEGDEGCAPPDRTFSGRASSARPLRREDRSCASDGEIRAGGPSMARDRVES